MLVHGALVCLLGQDVGRGGWQGFSNTSLNAIDDAMNPYYIDLGDMTPTEREKWSIRYSEMIKAVQQIERTEYQRGWEDCARNKEKHDKSR